MTKSFFDQGPGADGNTAAAAVKMDEADPLAKWKAQFHTPKTKDGSNMIYMCGNSLGLQPITTQAAIMQELEDWKNLGVEGHFRAATPWLPYHEFLGGPLAKLTGSKSTEVVAANSLTVNLHLMMVSFYQPTRERFKILIERDAFPSDRYAVESQIDFHYYDPAEALITIAPREGEYLLRDEDILEIIEREGDSIALILIGGVNYYTGQMFDMKAITEAGHKKGCKVGFDLAHAIGNVPLSLHDWGVDFACWCSYKYLNSGPGSIGGYFVHERYNDEIGIPRFAGWWGHDKKKRFEMGPKFNPIPGAEGWQLSNPPILSLAAVKASLDIFDKVGMQALREKSLKLTSYMERLLREWCDESITIITPKEPARRGCQLSLITGRKGKDAYQLLNKQGFVCDWREPDCIRVAPVPLYNSYLDAFKFAQNFVKLTGKDK